MRSQGFEFTAAGQITPEIKLLAGYVFADAVVTKDNVLPVGAPLINVPRHSGSLLAVHEAQDGPWKGFGIGGGVRAVGERAGDAAGSGFRLPGYIAVDALAYYRWENFPLRLNVENVFDTTYYESSLSALRVYPGAPRRSPAPCRCGSDGGTSPQRRLGRQEGRCRPRCGGGPRQGASAATSRRCWPPSPPRPAGTPEGIAASLTRRGVEKPAAAGSGRRRTSAGSSPASPPKPNPARPPRDARTCRPLKAIDALRGFVMLLMLVDHVRDIFYVHAQVRDPMDLASLRPPWR